MSINATLIGQMITFTLLVWFTMKYIWPPLIGAIEERKSKIAEGLAAAEKGQEDMERAAKKAANVLREAKQQSADIVNLAQKRANEIVEESKGTAKQEGARMIEAAQAQIEQEMQRAQEQMRKEVSALALKAAGQILQQEIDNAKHKELLGKVSEQLGQA
ncbi:MAG: F0F1 ATP synthase subunit B [Gammaproteobacteria bacterium]|uniref:F0F1 ATP synthase subunit B n=1 Tax=Methyloprofundus sp. TaxID=2020875 RepID=UPI00182C01A7|nr:F0F1 ATP synthase subunit B [Methyloprofundus sp.]MBT3811846.1 F0F1 ATP synthase subunit B [Gammaproteobacteria bacterium]HIL77521.1 F0F1 ATP synthase subunit B [Methylococcales bacterium]MBT4147454.1 F0F1 ATP synthase subunit B [Gammaproteobacteria bacterium]MBT5222459.1 F0F1 ATP synthase subunit B [Gammaproteobacteria bacterium]MBT5824635.1 F0F1 ATP synthase subunit B [Gammaproteobacteria bacterium]